MNPHDADALAASAAAYVHVPFCSAICPYCDFAVVAGQDDQAERYARALLREIELSHSWRPLESVYFGGGTPSGVDPALLGAVLNALDDRHGIATGAEISIEANPEDFTAAKAHALRSAGFNRVSFGAQSFDSHVLAYLGRRHDVDDIVGAMGAARQVGFENVSLDLIFGSPGESDESWASSVHRAIGLEPDHVSCYALTVERGTPLGRAVADGAAGPDPDIQADRYERAAISLAAAGLHRYEVSNWASPGKECRYNMVVWAQGEYEAYGNGAHGFRGGVRYRNHRRLEAYIGAVEEGQRPRAGEDRITGWDAEVDRLFVGLRRAVGVAEGAGTEALLASAEGGRLLESGVIETGGGRLRVARPLLTDAVHRSVLAQSAPIVSVNDDA